MSSEGREIQTEHASEQHEGDVIDPEGMQCFSL